MSLLLDALKKAAEQKAAKARNQDPESGDAGYSAAGEDQTLQDQSELDTRLERTLGEKAEAGIDSPETTMTRRLASSRAVHSGQDETVLLVEDEASESNARDAADAHRDKEDETFLTQLADEDPTSMASRAAASGRLDRADETQIRSPISEDTITRSPAAGRAPQTDETRIDIPPAPEDETDHRKPAPGSDETRIEIPADSGDETRYRAPVTRSDETRIDLPPGEDDKTAYRAPARQAADETRIDLPPTPEDETGSGARAPRNDETRIDLPAEAGEETGYEAPVSRRDETRIEVPAAGEEEPERALSTSGRDKTDISIPRQGIDALEAGQARVGSPRPDQTGPRVSDIEDDDTGSNEDMSLLLVDRDPTQFTSMTSPTDPQRSVDVLRALSGADGDEDLALIDTTRHRIPDDATGSTLRSRHENTATTDFAEDTRTARNSMSRADMTSTHTYAPDNYDRTLMRLPSDNATRLFAGMKSDSDVVMTPDYAKQVFRSKSSAQRIQHYKAYGGIVLLILMSIGVYGVFEYLEESDNIDASLRSLKQDPMPGIIRPKADQKQPVLIPEPIADDQTRRILEKATREAGESPASEGESSDVATEEPDTRSAATSEITTTTEGQSQPDDPAVAGTGSDGSSQAGAASEETVPAVQQPATARSSSEPTKTTRVAAAGGGETSAPAVEPVAKKSQNLQIQTSSRIERKHTLLSEAYQAYLAGNDELALERYNQVLALDPGNRNALLARAAIQIQNGNTRAAIEDYQTLLLANPKDSLAMSSLLAVANYAPSESETQLKLMIRDEPESPYLNFALANVFGAQSRWQEAQGHYFIALKNNPEDPNYAYNLAVSLEHIAQPGTAVSYYRRALENYNKGLATFSRETVDRRLEILGQP